MTNDPTMIPFLVRSHRVEVRSARMASRADYLAASIRMFAAAGAARRNGCARGTWVALADLSSALDERALGPLT